MATTKSKTTKKTVSKKASKAKKVSKADMVRVILRRDLGKKTDEQILSAVMKKTGHKKGLAKSYVKHYTPLIKKERAAAKKK